MLVLLVWGARASYNKVEMLVDGVKKVNPCSDAALGALLPDVEQGTLFTGTESQGDVRALCASLKFTCCSRGDLDFLLRQMKSSFAYLNYRAKVVGRLFKRVQDIAEETLRVFLNEVTEADTKCYTDLVERRFADFREAHSGNQALLEKMGENHFSLSFDVEKMVANFKLMKGVAAKLLGSLKEGGKDRERFYSGMLCSVCSPMFTKYFRVEQGRPRMQANKHFCMGVLERQVKTLKIVEIYKYLQRLLDLSFCVRRNSKPDLDFEGLGPGDLQMLPAPFEFYYELIDERNFCLAEVDRFARPPKEGQPDCPRLCRDAMHLFDQDYIALDKVIQAETELQNTFLRKPDAVPAQEVLTGKLQSYASTRQEFVDLGTVALSGAEASPSELVSVLRVKPGSAFRFSDLDIEVTNFMGVNSFNTPMDPAFYASALLPGALALVWTLWAN